MKDYYDLIVKLSLKLCTKDDYIDKLKSIVHNTAARKLYKLEIEMKQYDCEEVLHKLLSHEDDRVKLSASAICLRNNVIVDQAIPVLRNVMQFSSDPTFRFSAEMLLKSIAK